MSDWQWLFLGVILGWAMAETTHYFNWKKKRGKK